MHFQRYSLIYATLDQKLVEQNFSGSKGFSIEIAIQPENFDKYGFQLILTIHDGNDHDQLLLGQWGSSLIIMNGDDYNHKKNTKRIIQKIASDPSKKIFLSLTTGSKGSNLYIDGKLVRSDPHLTVQFPSASQSRLTVGNSVYGKHPWKGYVLGLRLYDYELAPASIEAHYKSWAESKNFEFTKKDHPSLLYLFNEKKGDKVIDHMNGESPLLVPSKFHVLKKIILSPPMPYSASTKTLISDVTINFIGFIPLGFLVGAFLLQLGRSKKQALIQTVVLCFCLSLGIEIVQAWDPSRSSQSLDVILNTLGGMTGALIHKYSNFTSILFAP
jgi:VanZ family protein